MLPVPIRSLWGFSQTCLSFWIIPQVRRRCHLPVVYCGIPVALRFELVPIDQKTVVEDVRLLVCSQMQGRIGLAGVQRFERSLGCLCVNPSGRTPANCVGTCRTRTGGHTDYDELRAAWRSLLLAALWNPVGCNALQTSGRHFREGAASSVSCAGRNAAEVSVRGASLAGVLPPAALRPSPRLPQCC